MATLKQKNAIVNLLSYIRTWHKYNHSCITEKELRIIANMSFNTASRQINKLIWEVEMRDNDLMWAYWDIMCIGS